jgi:hypothetical protein
VFVLACQYASCKLVAVGRSGAFKGAIVVAVYLRAGRIRQCLLCCFTISCCTHVDPPKFVLIRLLPQAIDSAVMLLVCLQCTCAFMQLVVSCALVCHCRGCQKTVSEPAVCVFTTDRCKTFATALMNPACSCSPCGCVALCCAVLCQRLSLWLLLAVDGICTDAKWLDGVQSLVGCWVHDRLPSCIVLLVVVL